MIEDIDEEETRPRTLGISYLNNETLFSSWTEAGPLLVHAKRK